MRIWGSALILVSAPFFYLFKLGGVLAPQPALALSASIALLGVCLILLAGADGGARKVHRAISALFNGYVSLGVAVVVCVAAATLVRGDLPLTAILISLIGLAAFPVAMLSTEEFGIVLQRASQAVATAMVIVLASAFIVGPRSIGVPLQPIDLSNRLSLVLFEDYQRFSFFFDHPNTAALWGGLFILIGLYARPTRDFLLVGIGILVLLTSGARTPVMAAVIAITLANIACGRRSKAAWALLLFIIPAGLIWLVSSGGNGRLAAWHFYWTRLSEYAAWGTSTQERLELASQAPWGAVHAHNLILDFALQYGLAAALVAATWIVLLLIRSWSIARTDSQPLALVVTVYVAVCGVSEPLFTMPVPAQAFLIMALVASISFPPNRRSELRNTKNPAGN